MAMTERGKLFNRLSLLVLLSATMVRAQAPAPATAGQEQRPIVTERRVQRTEEGQGQALFGKIAVINNGSVELTKPDGSTVSVKITDKTEYRKDRQAAKLGDFKVGDLVFVRLDENADHGMTAKLIGGGSGAGPEGGKRGLGGMGKDFVAGEGKSFEWPKAQRVAWGGWKGWTRAKGKSGAAIVHSGRQRFEVDRSGRIPTPILRHFFRGKLARAGNSTSFTASDAAIGGASRCSTDV